jgi:hypothetical protein
MVVGLQNCRRQEARRYEQSTSSSGKKNGKFKERYGGQSKDGQQLERQVKNGLGGWCVSDDRCTQNEWDGLVCSREMAATRRFLKGTMRLSKTVQTYVQPTTALLHSYTTTLSRKHKHRGQQSACTKLLQSTERRWC